MPLSIVLFTTVSGAIIAGSTNEIVNCLKIYLLDNL